MKGNRYRYTTSQVPLGVDAGLRSYLQREFEAIARNIASMVTPEQLEEAILTRCVTPAYMEIFADALPAAVPDIGTAWQRVTQWQTEAFPPKGFTFNPTNASFTILELGTFAILLTLILDHNVSSSVGRAFYVRFYNLTLGIAGRPLRIYTGRGEEGTEITASFGRAVLDETWIGDEVVVEYGGTDDAYTDVVMQVASLFMFSVSEKIV